MTPDRLAHLHRAAFAVPPPWSAQTFGGLLADPAVFLLISPCSRAFLIGRAAADEAELLTLATDPAARRRGLARALLGDFDAEARQRGALTAYLEVVETNHAAQALYAACGWASAGRRPGYYRRPADQGGPMAATVMRKQLS